MNYMMWIRPLIIAYWLTYFWETLSSKRWIATIPGAQGNHSKQKTLRQQWHLWQQWQGVISIRCIASYADNSDPLSRPFSCLHASDMNSVEKHQSIRTLWNWSIIGEVCNTRPVLPLNGRWKWKCCTTSWKCAHRPSVPLCGELLLPT